MKRIFISLIILSILWFASCKKDSNTNGNLKSDAILKWQGDYAADGCGYFIYIKDHEYKPSNESIIDSSFRKDSTAVNLEYQLSDKVTFNCGDLPYSLSKDGIKIISISKK